MISTITLNTTSITSAQILNFSLIVVIPLIALLVLKEIFKGDSKKNNKIQSFITGTNISIVPLLLVFVTIVAYKILEIIR